MLNDGVYDVDVTRCRAKQ